METNYSLADVAAATGGDGFGGANAWVLIILFALIFGGGGFGFGNNASALSQADLQRAIDLNSVQNGQRDIEARVQEIGAENITAIKDAAYNNLSEIRDTQAAVNAGFATLSACCCDTNRNIDGVKYDLSNAIHAEGEATRALMQQNKIESLQAQINNLQLQSAMCGVVKYPNATTYSANWPFSNGCGCGNI